MCNNYQGFSNYPTWAFKLWIDNEEGSYNYWNDKAQSLADKHGKDGAVSYLAEELKNDITEFMPELEGMYSDIFTWAMGQVDWREIAESMLEDIEVEADTDDPMCQCGHRESEHYHESGTCLADVVTTGGVGNCPCLEFEAEEE